MIVVMMTMTITMTVVVVVVCVEATALDVKDLDAHVDDGGVLILFLGRSV